MNLIEIIIRFRQSARLPHKDEELANLILNKAIELISTDDDPHNDYYLEAIKMVRNLNELKQLINTKREYRGILLAATLVVFDELTLYAKWDETQKREIASILNEIEKYIPTEDQ